MSMYFFGGELHLCMQIYACIFMHAYFSFELSTNYARLDVKAVNNGGRLRERL